MDPVEPLPYDASPAPWTEAGLLSALRASGATGMLAEVRFRRNRSTIWSVTRAGRRLNLHTAYRRAPDEVVRALSVLVREVAAGRRGGAYRAAARTAREWPGIAEGIRRVRQEDRRNGSGRSRTRSLRPGPCCATDAQRDYLRRLYRLLARRHFGRLLPPDLHLRLSRRMTSRLGHMRGGWRGGERSVVEIALSLDLMVPGNEAELVETLLHEMAHAADWIGSGGLGHGPSWKAWARRVGCSPRARCTGPLRRRRRHGEVVDGVPASPPENLVPTAST